MHAARRHVAAITPLVIAALLLTGCTVRIIDPAADDAPSSAPQEAAPAPQDETTPRATSSPDKGNAEATRPGLSAPKAAERERLIAAATITMTCPSGPLDDDGAIVRVEGSCASLVIDIDAGVVIADDIDELLLRGSNTVVYTETIGSATVSGSANEVYWTGPTPTLEDDGSANSLGRG